MSSQAPTPDSETKNNFFYSRKEKSLGVLCSNFLKLYNRDGVESLGLDDAANRLGVERRRIYDIVNILESVGVLTRKAKNQYFWKGFGAIPRALDALKVSNENYGVPLKPKADVQGKPSASSKVDSRKEKSLGLLTQHFVKLFLCSKVDVISLDDAATLLLGDIHDPTAMRTKVRRLYDIANVFSSMNLIEKTHHPESRKPGFRWLGLKGKSSKNGPAPASDLNESKKRVFGTEISNTVLKKCKEDSSIDRNVIQKENMPMHMRKNTLNDERGRNLLGQQEKHSSKSFVFGPFTPASVPEGVAENKNARRPQNLEDLPSYRPQYRNQALSDLFAHYVAAWKSWYVEADGKKHSKEVS